MKLWISLFLALSGGGIVLGVYVRRRWLAHEAAQIAALIRPARPVFLGADESLEVRARARREIADQVKQRSALIASGGSSASVLKMARKA